MVAITNSGKLLAASASAPTMTAATADRDAIAKPRLRPTLRIRIVAGTVVNATLITIIDTGNVAQAGFSASDAPMMPPSVTNTIDPVADINWQITSRTMLLLFIGRCRTARSGHSYTFERGLCNAERIIPLCERNAMADALIISGEVSIPMEDIEISAIRSQGAGGQNVNKVASAIHLRFDVRRNNTFTGQGS